MTEDERKNLEGQIAVEVNTAIEEVVKKYQEQGHNVAFGVDEQLRLTVTVEPKEAEAPAEAPVEAPVEQPAPEQPQE